MELWSDYRRLFLEERPLLDARAPVEFANGAFPNAVNLPLLDDDEREQVGIRYKEQGSEAAVRLGHELVRGETRERRVAAWIEFFDRHPDGLIYCFRGGLRSEMVQRWLAEAGVAVPRVAGGYKAMRRYLLEQTGRLCAEFDLTLLGGRTGVGKTEVLYRLPRTIDLEGLANHRGSGFGRRVTPQPTPIDFENALAIEWLKLEASGATGVVMEDESRCIGRCALPQPLWGRFREAPVVVLTDDDAERVHRIRREYVEAMVADFRDHYGDEGFDRFARHLTDSLDRIRKRLGGERHAELRGLMSDALAVQRETGDTGNHDAWIRRLLAEYYDPMYDYQLESKRSRVVFEGTAAEVIDYLAGNRG